jgi:hypothetical protein
MPRYVILEHETSDSTHFDFMLEMDGLLKTWSLPQPPSPGMEQDAEVLPDHRLAYLDYEGPISGDRGSVKRWDRGTYDVQFHTELEWIVRLNGEKLIGVGSLRHSPAVEKRWRFCFTP